MMTEQVYYTIWFFVGVLLLSVGVSYAWWTKVRVLWLRQDIYDIRDNLFMESARLDRADDQAAKCARDHLNALARVASVISFPLVITAINTGEAEVRELLKSENAKLNKFIKLSMEKAGNRIARYLTRETLTGWIIVILSRVVFMTWVLQSLYSGVQQWRESDAAEDALRIFEKDGKRHRWTAA